VVILLATLAPKGTSVLRSKYVINRVYEDLAQRLSERGVHHAHLRHLSVVRRPRTASGPQALGGA
jgi:UDP-N-acetylglucosamine 1-carboxyvinyltransferase